MAVQVSYPGVYIDEFAPGAPIEGVSTSTAAFVGTALRGPIGAAVRIQSWDAFEATFGGFIAEGPPDHLSRAVFGFFLNGGTTCYVVRVGTGVASSAGLDSRQGGANPDPVIIVRALVEGPAGDSYAAQIAESSRLADNVETRVPVRAVSNQAGNNLSITVPSVDGYVAGMVARLVNPPDEEDALVTQVTAPSTIAFAAALGANYAGGEVRAAPALAVRRASTQVNVGAGGATALTVTATDGFAGGDRLRLADNADANVVTVLVDEVVPPVTLRLAGPIPGNVDYAGGTARTADLGPGLRTLRVVVPPAVRLTDAVPRGATVLVDRAGVNEVTTVESSGGDTLTFDAGITGTYALDDPAVPVTIATLEFDVTVTDAGTGTTEGPPNTGFDYTRLATDPRHPRYWLPVTSASELVAFEAPDAPPAPMPDDPRPVEGVTALAGGQADDRAAAEAALIADPTSTLDLLDARDDVSIVCAPGITDAAVQQAMVDHCEKNWDRVAILDPIAGLEPGGDPIRDQFAAVRRENGFAALYYPRIVARHPLSGTDQVWAPSGHIAGIYARTDQREGVHKAPANTNIRGALGLEVVMSDHEQGPLNLLGINCLRVLFGGQSQPVVWGARTNATDTNWRYVNIRRLFNYIEESIQEGIRWAVFEPNGLPLWQQLKRTISAFLTQAWRNGALFGAKAEEAYYVRIDEVLNPESQKALGRLTIEVGVRPTYPAEFIILRIGIWRGGSDVTES